MNELDKNKEDFESLVGKIQSTSSALQEDARLVINRNVTTRAWLTGFYIVEYEQHGNDRAKYGEGLLKCLAERLKEKSWSQTNLKNARAFYLSFPELSQPVAHYLMQRFGKSQSLPDFLLFPDFQTYADMAQLNMYLEYYRRHYMRPDDNSPVGLLLCTEYGQEMVEYVTPNIDPQLFVAQYALQLPSKDKIKEGG